MSQIGDTAAKLDIGRVIQQTFGVLGRNFATFLVLTVILVGIPGVLAGLLQLNFLRAGQLFAWPTVVGGLLAGLASVILQATMIYGTVTDLNGGRASVSDCLSIGLRTFVPVLAIGILFGLSVGFGSMVLLFPGLMVLCAWCLCVPVYVAERTTVFGAFSRSAALTKGNRWRIFALVILYFIALLIIEALMGFFSSPMRIVASGGATIGPLRALALTPLLNIANALVGTVGIAALYTELRRVREGVGPEGLAAIFD
jgi:hypothetical protein